jgi:hypothetical protein
VCLLTLRAGALKVVNNQVVAVGIVNRWKFRFTLDFDSGVNMNPGMILVQRLKRIDDPRVVGRCDHVLVDILVIALCAMMAGAEGWDDMEAWGEANEERLRHYLELRNGIPGHDTIRRVFEAIDPKRLEAVLLEWIGHVCPALGKVKAIDGVNFQR